MNRPYVIIHTVCSVDGRVSLGVNRTGFEDIGDKRWQAIWASRISLEESARRMIKLHRPQVMLEGSSSFVVEGGPLKPLPPSEFDPRILYRDYLPKSVVRRAGHRGWLAVVDGRGRLRGGMKEFPGWDGWRTLHLTSLAAPPEYLAFLRRSEIPYLVAGRERVDLKKVLSKMSSALGVSRLFCTAGSRLNGALLRAGLVDELSLVLLPALIGGTRTPVLFGSPELGPREWPSRLKLMSARSEPGGRVLLRYKILPDGGKRKPRA